MATRSNSFQTVKTTKTPQKKITVIDKQRLPLQDVFFQIVSGGKYSGSTFTSDHNGNIYIPVDLSPNAVVEISMIGSPTMRVQAVHLTDPFIFGGFVLKNVRVVDGEGNPLQGAKISVPTQHTNAVTNAAGNATLSLANFDGTAIISHTKENGEYDMANYPLQTLPNPVVLYPIQTASFRGDGTETKTFTVTNAEGTPLENVHIIINGNVQTITNSNGSATVTVSDPYTFVDIQAVAGEPVSYAFFNLPATVVLGANQLPAVIVTNKKKLPWGWIAAGISALFLVISSNANTNPPAIKAPKPKMKPAMNAPKKITL